MQNDDKRLQQLFEDYHPALESDDRFMRRVRQQLAVVDMLRREQAALKARSRKAIAAAAVAGFVAGYQQSGGDYEAALRLGTACGSATAFSLGLATKADIDALLATM